MSKGKGGKLAILIALLVGGLILCLLLWAMLIMGSMDMTTGCLYRYSFGNDLSVDKIVNTVNLNANANYTALSGDSSKPHFARDIADYGKWLNTNLKIDPGQKVDFVIKGDVSLCMAYVPKYNLEKTSDRNFKGELIPIPRVEDGLANPVNLIFDARTDEWRNIAEVFPNDRVVVSLYKDLKTTSNIAYIYSSNQGRNITADCRENKQVYSPICGRYSIWGKKSPYVDKCKYEDGAWRNVYKEAPEAYRNDGSYTRPWLDATTALGRNYNVSCTYQYERINSEVYQNQKYFWFSADEATGLLYRYDTNLDPTNKKDRGLYSFAKVQDAQLGAAENNNYQVILDVMNETPQIRYLQYRFHDYEQGFSNNTGGYVLNIKQTKCRRSNGQGKDDLFKNRGAVEYVIVNYGTNPNSARTAFSSAIVDINAQGEGHITAEAGQKGYLWLRIKNNSKDYMDSTGQYQVQFSTARGGSGFYELVLDPLLNGLKTRVKNASITIFKNMTCHNQSKANCTSFFTYTKGILTIYIALYGMMFLLGMVRISQTDLVIRVIKIGFVAGLINGSTFEFFNTYVFDIVTNFSDEIIANMSGYSLFNGSTKISNPLQFMNSVLTRVFTSSTFAAQMMAMLAMGLNGLMYFAITFVCVCMLIIVLFRATAIYLMAYMAIAVLIGLAPIFITFILFERTWYLFDNWVRFLFKYMIEPVILLAGIIILTQLMTIYLDQVVGYSVCWKCAIPIKLPFPTVPDVTPAFLDVELFCLNWFAPWGFDHRANQLGIGMQHISVLLILACCLWEYVDFSSTIVSRLTGGVMAPSATSMGSAMANAFKESGLKQVGLDQKTRSAVNQRAKQRADSIKTGNLHSPLDKDQRHDVKNKPDAQQSGDSTKQEDKNSKQVTQPSAQDSISMASDNKQEDKNNKEVTAQNTEASSSKESSNNKDQDKADRPDGSIADSQTPKE